MDFAFLHVYSGFSLLKSALSVDKLIRFAVKEGYKAVGLTDYASLSGLPSLYHESKGTAISPVYGMDIPLDDFVLSLFAKNEEGYRNLLAIHNTFAKGKIDLAYIKAHCEGLNVVLPIETSPSMNLLRTGNEKESVSFLLQVSKGFPSFYLGLPYLPFDQPLAASLREFTKKYPYDVVAFPHLLYPQSKDAITLSILKAIDNEEHLLKKEDNGINYALSLKEIEDFYLSNEIANTMAIAASSSLSFAFKRGGLLTYPWTEGLDSPAFLRKKANEGLNRYVAKITPDYQKRLDEELDIIISMGYADYFLLVADYVNYAKEKNIPVGPGRGSAAGSLVAYCLGIIESDPLRYGLLFYRFLNPERQSMPDIDVDFADDRREEVISYIKERFGEDKVAHIITFSTIGAKQAIRDVGKIYSYPDTEIDMVAKMVDGKLTLRQNYKANPRFAELVNSDPYYLSLISLAAKIEGLPRQSGLHASGIVINNSPLTSSIPVIYQEEVGNVVTYEMNFLEEQGFLKMDVLSLNNLTLIQTALNLINKNKEVIKSIKDIPYDDPKAMALIGKGKTMGLFQLESEGMNKTIKEVGINTFDDLVAVIALFRPGPMDDIPKFVAAKNKGYKPYLEDKSLEPILQETHGVIIYQEQVMLICQKAAGMSLSEADIFRAAISKKNIEKMASLKGKFISGCINKGMSEKNATSLYNRIAKFAGYGFNKSHALTYAMIAGKMAYLKAYYSASFYSAVFGGKDVKTLPLIREALEIGLHFKNPSINISEEYVLPLNDDLYFPLSMIKGINGQLCRDIIYERQTGGPYKDVYDFVLRVKRYSLSKENFVNLVDAGAFDEFNPNRHSLRLSSSALFSYAEMILGEDGTGSLLDLGFPKPMLIEAEENKLDDLNEEARVLGIMVSGSPLDNKAEIIKQRKLSRLSSLEKNGNGDYVAIIESVRTKITKKGTKMAFLTLYDELSSYRLTMFSEVYEKAYSYLKEGAIVEVKIKKDSFKEDSYLILEIKPL